MCFNTNKIMKLESLDGGCCCHQVGWLVMSEGSKSLKV